MRKAALVVAMAVAMVFAIPNIASAMCADTEFFSKLPGEWIVKKFNKDDANFNICIVGRVANDNDCAAYYSSEGDFRGVVYDSTGAVAYIDDNMKCACGTAEQKNQYFICRALVPKIKVGSASQIVVQAQNYTPTGCNWSDSYNIPGIVVGTDADGTCIADNTEGSGGSGGGFMVANQLADDDDDGVPNVYDNCRDVANADQADTDSDGVGDACEDGDEADADSDGVPDISDNCPNDYNPQQEDADEDGLGDACEADAAPPSSSPPGAETGDGGMCSLNVAAGPNAAPFLMMALALIPILRRRRRG